MRIRVGDRVQHRGTLQWGQVLEVVPYADGTSELHVQPETALFPDQPNEPRWWASYHVSGHQPKEVPV